MTIHGLSTFLGKQCPYYRHTVPIQWLAGKRVAVDTYLIGYAYMSTALGSEAKKVMHTAKIQLDQEALLHRWLGRFLATITVMREANIKPVFIFDGQAPPEKEATRLKRQQRKANVRSQIEECRERLREEDLELDMETRERIVKLMSRDVRVTDYHWRRLTTFLEDLGLPIVKAKGEGEALCASLVKSRQCYAVFTQDSDAGAYLTPRVITKIENPTYDSEGNLYQHCEMIYYRQVVDALRLSPEQFVDLCCLCANDCSDNVPGWGPAKCYKLLRKYGRIEQIPVEVIDFNQINYPRLREIFAEVGEIAEGELTEHAVDPNLTQKLAGYGLLKSAGRLLSILRIQEGIELNADLAQGFQPTAQLELDPAELL